MAAFMGLAGLRSRLSKPRGQSMVEYSLVIAGVALVVLYGGYVRLGAFVVNVVSSVTGLL